MTVVLLGELQIAGNEACSGLSLTAKFQVSASKLSTAQGWLHIIVTHERSQKRSDGSAEPGIPSWLVCSRMSKVRDYRALGATSLPVTHSVDTHRRGGTEILEPIRALDVNKEILEVAKKMKCTKTCGRNGGQCAGARRCRQGTLPRLRCKS